MQQRLQQKMMTEFENNIVPIQNVASADLSEVTEDSVRAAEEALFSLAMMFRDHSSYGNLAEMWDKLFFVRQAWPIAPIHDGSPPESLTTLSARKSEIKRQARALDRQADEGQRALQELDDQRARLLAELAANEAARATVQTQLAPILEQQRKLGEELADLSFSRRRSVVEHSLAASRSKALMDVRRESQRAWTTWTTTWPTVHRELQSLIQSREWRV